MKFPYKFITIIVFSGLLLSCANNKRSKSAKSSSDSTAQSKPAETVDPDLKFSYSDHPEADLSKLSKNDDGAYILFDGSSLEGWRGYNKDSVPKQWAIEDHTLKFSKPSKRADDDDRGDLIFAHEFQNFEFEFEWKISEGGNSGVFYLAKEVEGEPIYISSPEYQVLDNERHPDAKMGEDGNRKSASLYDMIPAKPQNSNPAGEWNKGKIVVEDGKITHYQNGEAVVEYEVWTDDWIDLLQKSKFSEKEWPLAFELLKNIGGENKSGVVGFQDHGDEVWFRNITLKPL